MIMEEQKRRFSEAGVNRRPSAAHILTEVRTMRRDSQRGKQCCELLIVVHSNNVVNICWWEWRVVNCSDEFEK